MKYLSTLLLVFIATMALPAWATRTYEKMAESQPLAPAAQLGTIDLAWDGIYEVQKDMEVIPESETFDGRHMTNEYEESFRLIKGEPVAIQFVNDRVVLSFAPELEKNVDQTTPDSIVITREQAAHLGLKLLGRGKPSDLPYAEFTGKTNVAGRFVLRENGRFVASGCLAYVLKKLHIHNAGHIGGASKMTAFLKRAKHWKPVSCTNPPVGSVGSWNGKQHTAIWNGRGWCFDEGCFDPGRGYHLFECVHP
jgi:hypothetical protein